MNPHKSVVHLGDLGEAIEHYRQCTAFIDANPDGFGSDGLALLRRQFQKATGQRRRTAPAIAQGPGK